MSEVVRMLEGDGLAETWDALQKMDTPKCRSLEQQSPKYVDFMEDSSLVLEAIELSGPRYDRPSTDMAPWHRSHQRKLSTASGGGLLHPFPR
ncbi:hypothetical protein BHE74_00002345 [Ensete ventricosum]|nr:hypothetical protein BHE74_00002345 [Ensete ventricosum]